MLSFVLSVNAPNILPYIPAGPAIRDFIKVLDSHFVINSIVEGSFSHPTCHISLNEGRGRRGKYIDRLGVDIKRHLTGHQSALSEKILFP